MKKLSEIYKELGIAFTFPIVITDSNDNETYYENSSGFWYRKEYDESGNRTYFESRNSYWDRKEYDRNGKETYFENNEGYTRGTKRQSCNGKVIAVDDKQYKLIEL